jgi:hypothetical protein
MVPFIESCLRDLEMHASQDAAAAAELAENQKRLSASLPTPLLPLTLLLSHQLSPHQQPLQVVTAVGYGGVREARRRQVRVRVVP